MSWPSMLIARRRRVVEPRDEPDERRLAAAGQADERRALPRLRRRGSTSVEHRSVRRVAERARARTRCGPRTRGAGRAPRRSRTCALDRQQSRRSARSSPPPSTACRSSSRGPSSACTSCRDTARRRAARRRSAVRRARGGTPNHSTRHVPTATMMSTSGASRALTLRARSARSTLSWLSLSSRCSSKSSLRERLDDARRRDRLLHHRRQLALLLLDLARRLLDPPREAVHHRRTAPARPTGRSGVKRQSR